MGQDLAKKAAPAFKKAWDRERLAMVTGDLFSFALRPPTQILQIDLCADGALKPGQIVHIHNGPEGWFVSRDLQRVGVLDDVPPQLQARATAGESVFSAVVTEVHPEAGIAEVKTS
jgi:hypothetical protein